MSRRRRGRAWPSRSTGPRHCPLHQRHRRRSLPYSDAARKVPDRLRTRAVAVQQRTADVHAVGGDADVIDRRKQPPHVADDEVTPTTLRSARSAPSRPARHRGRAWAESVAPKRWTDGDPRADTGHRQVEADDVAADVIVGPRAGRRRSCRAGRSRGCAAEPTSATRAERASTVSSLRRRRVAGLVGSPCHPIAAETDGAIVAQRTVDVLPHRFSACPTAGEVPVRGGTSATSDIPAEFATSDRVDALDRGLRLPDALHVEDERVDALGAKRLQVCAPRRRRSARGDPPERSGRQRGCAGSNCSGAMHARNASTTIALVKWPGPLPKAPDPREAAGKRPWVRRLPARHR